MNITELESRMNTFEDKYLIKETEDRNIDEVFRYLSKFDGCIFEASYYIDYIVGQKRSNMGFKNSFNIEWELKTFINKMRSKNGITIY